MKKLITTAAAAAVLSAGLVGTTTATASADTPRCVSKSEYRQVHRGDSKAKVKRIFDTGGKQDAISHGGGYTFEIRSYKTCTRYGAVSVSFTNGKVDSKFAVW